MRGKQQRLPKVNAMRLREMRFAAAYVRNNGNASAAVRESGFIGRRADDQGWRMLERPRVQALIRREQRKLADMADVHEAQVTRELAAIAFADVRNLFDEDGTLRAIKDMDAATAHAIASIEVDEIFAGVGEERKAIGVSRRVKFWPKNDALKLLCQKLGLLKPVEVKHDVSDSLAELIRQSMQAQSEPTKTITDGRVIEHESR